jgi:carboxylesterase
MKQGRAALLLHGLCSTAWELHVVARALRSSSFHVSTPTLSGDTAEDARPPTCFVDPDFRRWIAEAAAEVDLLAQSYAEVTICGARLGAVLALGVAMEASRNLDALSLISTTLICDGWNASRWRFLMPVAEYTPLGRLYRHRETPPYGVKNARLRAWVGEELARGRFSPVGAFSIPTISLREADRLARHVKSGLGNVRTPTLMIHAREDDVASLANVRLVQQRIGTDHFAEVIVEDSYHRITLDNDCELAGAKTIQFFDAEAKRRAEASHAMRQWAGREERQ